MKRCKQGTLAGFSALFVSICLLAGCKTWNYSIHHEGVYAIVYDPTNIPVGRVDIDSLRFRLEKHSFGPDEQPAALLVGNPKPGKAEVGVIDLTTGKTIATKRILLTLDYAVLQPLHFSQSGSYEIYVGRPHAPHASYDFSVNRETNAAGLNNTNRLQTSVFSDRWIQLDLSPKQSWKNYDRAFTATIEKRWDLLIEKDSSHTNYHGSVAVFFELQSNGQISNLQVKTNTVNVQAAAICQRAILDPVPYPPWPEEMRKRIGKDSREIKFNFYFY
jgi:hypothetical protein